MPEYGVTFTYKGFITVEADSPGEAKEIARLELEGMKHPNSEVWDLGDFVDEPTIESVEETGY